MKSRIAEMCGRVALLVAAAAGAACSVDSQEAPPLAGPSGMAQTVTLTASPDQLPRDGSSQSVVTVTVRNETGQPVAGQRLALSASGGTLSASEVVTGSAGTATVTVTAPPSSTPTSANGISVFATPVSPSNNTPTSTTRSISIALTGTRNTTAPTPAFTVNPESPSLMETVLFDANGTQDEGAACGNACTYAWDFGGESTATGKVVTYRFLSARTYPVTLTVTDAAGTTATLTQNITVVEGAAPTAAFSFSPTSPAQLEPVNFSADASTVGVAGRTITSYDWQFGDGTTGSGRNVQHAYSVVGTYNVTLTVTDSAGLRATTSESITVVNGVTADFTYSPTDPAAGENVFFNAEASRGSSGFGGRSPIVKYIWHFGKDANLVETTEPITSTTFPDEGTYTVTLTVEDSAGRRDTTSQEVEVGP